MPLPKFADLDKAAKDLLSEDYPLEPKLSLKSTAKNGLNLKVDVNKAGDNVNGTLKCKLAHSSGVVLEEKWTTSNDVTTELSADNKLGAGTKISLKSLFSPKAGPKSLSGTLEYNNPTLNTEASLDHSFGKNPLTLNLSGVASYGNFRFGGSAKVPVQNFQNIDNHALGVQYITSDLAVTSTVSNFSRVEGSIYHDVRPGVTAALKFSWDRNNTNDAAQLEVGGRYSLDADSFVKAKFDTKQNLTLSYTQNLQKGVSFTLGTQLFPPKGGDVASLSGKVGFSLNLS